MTDHPQDLAPPLITCSVRRVSRAQLTSPVQVLRISENLLAIEIPEPSDENRVVVSAIDGGSQDDAVEGKVIPRGWRGVHDHQVYHLQVIYFVDRVHVDDQPKAGVRVFEINQPFRDAWR